MKSVCNEVVQPWGWRGRRWRRWRGNIGASEKVGNKTTTQLGCVFVSMIRVAPAGSLGRRGGREKLCWNKVKYRMNDTPRRDRELWRRRRAEKFSEPSGRERNA